MRPTIFLLSALLLVVVGCKKADAPAGDTPATSPSASTSASPAASPAADTGDLKSKVVGEWTMANQQGTSTVDADIHINEDGTYVNEGKIVGETPGEAATVKMTISYKMSGKWTIEGDGIVSTPGDATVKVEDIQVTAKDPANQAALDAQKEELGKKAEEQAKAGMMQASTAKVESATADELHLSNNGAKVTYTRKK
jgi:hypothetical protein